VADMKIWIKIGIVGSVIEFLVVLLFSYNGTGWGGFHLDGSRGITLLLTGCAGVWVISYIFYRDKK
jgi:hypothetical protein